MLQFRVFRWMVFAGLGAGIYILSTHFSVDLSNKNLIAASVLTVSGILGGVIMAYVLAKIFQLKQEQNENLLRKELLGTKLTNFRKLLFRIMKSPSFWVRHDDILLLKRKFPEITFESIHNELVESDSNVQFWKDEENFSTATADLYLAMELITGDIEDKEDIEDAASGTLYSAAYLKKIQPALNQIWFYLEEKYAKHTAGLINDHGIWEPYQDAIRNLLSKIDNGMRRKEFDRLAVAELANAFYETHIPKMIKLSAQPIGDFKRSLVSLGVTLSIVVLGGIIWPLIIMLFNLPAGFVEITLLSSVFILTACSANFVFDLFILLFQDFKPKKQS